MKEPYNHFKITKETLEFIKQGDLTKVPHLKDRDIYFLYLKLNECKTFKEIGEMHNITGQSVRMRYVYAIEQINKFLLYGDVEKITQLPISQLPLSRRAINCLIKLGAKNLKDVSLYTYDSLFRMRNFGIHTLDEISILLQKVGLSFAVPKLEGLLDSLNKIIEDIGKLRNDLYNLIDFERK